MPGSSGGNPIQDAFAKAKTESREEVYAEMASVDLIPMNRLAKSRQIRKGLNARRLNPLTTPRHVNKDIDKFTCKVKLGIKERLQKLLKNGMRFSVTTDEATKFNRRYAVVNAHLPGGEPVGLGQVRIRGKFDGADAAECVRKKLREYDLDVTCHIVATTTDGASMMVRMGKLLARHHQKCHDHGLHLAVVDVLYKAPRPKPPRPATASPSSKDEAEASSSDESGDEYEESDTEEVSDSDASESEDEEEDEDEEGDGEYVDPMDVPEELIDEVGAIVDKIRKCCKKIRKSPVKNDALQEYIKKEAAKIAGMKNVTSFRLKGLSLKIIRRDDLCQRSS